MHSSSQEAQPSQVEVSFTARRSALCEWDRLILSGLRSSPPASSPPPQSSPSPSPREEQSSSQVEVLQRLQQVASSPLLAVLTWRPTPMTSASSTPPQEIRTLRLPVPITSPLLRSLQQPLSPSPTPREAESFWTDLPPSTPEPTSSRTGCSSPPQPRPRREASPTPQPPSNLTLVPFLTG